MTATDYAEAVVAGGVTAGPHVRDECRRFLRDRERTDVVYSESQEEWHVNVVESAFVLATKDGVVPFVLDDWQRYILGNLYGWRWGPGPAEGERRFRRAYVEFGRGIGKSPFAAAIGMLELLSALDDGAEVYVNATSLDVAGQVFDDMRGFVVRSGVLADLVRLLGGARAHTILSKTSNSRIRKVAYQTGGRGASGFRVKCAITDEYHEHPHGAMLGMLESGMKNQRDPLSLVITNAGANTSSPCYQLHEHACRVAAGEVEDDGLFTLVGSLDPNDDYRDEDVWEKTLPGWERRPGRAFIEDQLRLARQSPSKRAGVLRALFCEWITSTERFLDRAAWDSVRGDLSPPAERAKHPSYIGIDLGYRRDLTAMAIVTDFGDRYELETKVWMPHGSVERLEHTDGTPYRDMVDEGWIIETPGETMDFEHVAATVQGLIAELDVAGVTYDKWGFDELLRSFARRGIAHGRHWGDDLVVVPHPQGFMPSRRGDRAEDLVNPVPRLWMARSIDGLQREIVEGTITVAWNPLLWGAGAGIQLAIDGSGNRRPMKNKSTARIDILVAAFMAVGFADAARMVKGVEAPDDYTRELDALDRGGWQ